MKRLVALLSMAVVMFSGLYAQEEAQQNQDNSQKEINELKESILKRVEERLKLEQEKVMDQVRQLLEEELPKLYKKIETAKTEEKSGFLGIATAAITNEQKAQVGYEGESGIIITQVYQNTPAARIGLMPGDIINGLNEEVVSEVEKFRDTLKKYKPGEFVTLKFWRQGNDLSMKVKLAPRPEPQQAQAQNPQQPQQQAPERVKCLICNKEMGIEEAKTHRHEMQLKCTICGKAMKEDEAKTHHHHVQQQPVAVPGYLGVQLAELDDEGRKERKYNGDGVLIESVKVNSPADFAGLEEGDIVEAINNEYVSSLQELRSIIAGKVAGETVTLTIWRNGKEQDIETTLAPLIEKPAPQQPKRQQKRLRKAEEDDEGGNYGGALQQRIDKFLKTLNEEKKAEVKNVAPKPYLGIQIQESKNGLNVVKVVDNSPAQKAGLNTGDILKAVNGVALESEDTLRDFMGNAIPNSKATLTVLREGNEFTIETTLGARQ